MMNNKLAWAAIIGSSLIFGGCGSTEKKTDSNADGAVVQDKGSNGSGAYTSGASNTAPAKLHPLMDPNSAVYDKTVYFDFDQSTIRPEFASLLRSHAAYLNSNRDTSIIIEGHCDERGSREYNIALGERRAYAVKTFLEAEGVAGRQLETVSYGEERPAAGAHNEAGWAKNRRAFLKY